MTDLLRGDLDPELVKRWGWDRSQEGGAQKMLMPKRDLKDWSVVRRMVKQVLMQGQELMLRW